MLLGGGLVLAAMYLSELRGRSAQDPLDDERPMEALHHDAP